MTIRIYRDRIELGDFVLRETADGASFDGEVAAQQFLGNAFQGTVAGFASSAGNSIDKFPFATDTNAVLIGTHTHNGEQGSSSSSTTHGYTAGGYPSGSLNNIQKFSFATNGNASNIGTLATGRRSIGGGHSSSTQGFCAGGWNGPLGSFVYRNEIEKFPFSTDSNAIDHGDLTQARGEVSGQSSVSSGYTSGGTNSTPGTGGHRNTIDKYPFAANSNATDVGDLSATRWGSGGQSSATHGYSTGGYGAPLPAAVQIIDKFPFATDTNASDIGNFVTNFCRNNGGVSSVSFGYSVGGYNSNTMEKFPFSADSNATDVGDLTFTTGSARGNQY